MIQAQSQGVEVRLDLLTTKNKELLKQIGDLEQEIKLLSNELNNTITQKNSLIKEVDRLKDFERIVTELKTIIKK